jgi:MerR family transcriptional regulator/heat shock protein HspR
VAASSPATLSISAVSRLTNIPVSTLRFYERELPGLFHIRKTAGGHRRYGESDVARFVTVRRLTESEGLGLADVRRVLASRGDAEVLREEVERVRATGAADGLALRDLERRIQALEARIAAVEAAPARRGWLRRRT